MDPKTGKQPSKAAGKTKAGRRTNPDTTAGSVKQTPATGASSHPITPEQKKGVTDDLGSTSAIKHIAREYICFF